MSKKKYLYRLYFFVCLLFFGIVFSTTDTSPTADSKLGGITFCVPFLHNRTAFHYFTISKIRFICSFIIVLCRRFFVVV